MGNYGMPYGAVEIFSGYAAIGAYPQIDIPRGWEHFPPKETDDFTMRVVSKYLLRCMARAKDVHHGIGLAAVWQTINDLKHLVGEPPISPACFSDYSIRDAYRMMGYPNNPDLVPPNRLNWMTAKSLNAYLENTSPFALQGTISLRRLFAGIPPDRAGTAQLP